MPKGIPYGKHPALGNVGPTDQGLKRGNGCGVHCFGCGAALCLRRGKIRAAHFAHIPPTFADAAACRETAIHILAKDELAKWRGPVTLPPWHGHQFTVRIVEGKAEVVLANGRRVDALWRTDADEAMADLLRDPPPRPGGVSDRTAAPRPRRSSPNRGLAEPITAFPPPVHQETP